MTESRVLAIRPSAYDPPVPPSQPQKLEKFNLGLEKRQRRELDLEEGVTQPKFQLSCNTCPVPTASQPLGRSTVVTNAGPFP